MSATRPFVTGHSPLAIPRRDRRGGFALLITITLLAFLVLLLVSLASLTRVETQVASNSQQLAQARQNALMALNIAIGQLQKYAGPDQRTTARADLENTPGQTNAQWTGVYGSSVAADYNATPVTVATDLSTAANITTTGSPARLLNWLVSGNEPTAFNPVWNTGNVGAKGQITAYPDPADATSIPFRPAPTTSLTTAGTVANLTATTAATDTTLTITNAAGATKPARLLVGQNSVTSSVNGTQPIDYVVAPAIDITATVPGLTGTPTIGRYAWWVGDEGMKARVNLPLAGTDPALNVSGQEAAKQAQIRNAFSNSTRDAIELMASNTPNWATAMPALNAARIDTLYTPDQTVTGIMSPNQTPLASSNPSSMSAALKYRFHDITTQSVSVLSDTYAGGLKRDLSILLDSSYNTAAATDSTTANTNRMWVLHPGDTGGFVAGGGFAVPTWKHLRTYYQTRVPTSGTGEDTVTARLPVHNKTGVADDVGVGPVITYFSMGWHASPAAPRAAGVRINMNLYPLVVIWNPYNFTLKAPPPAADGISTYEVGVLPSYNVRVGLEKITPDPNYPNDPAKSITTRISSFDFQHVLTTNNGYFIRFRLKCPDIPPGQSLIFSLPPASSGQAYTQKNILENIEPESGAYVSVPFLDGSGNPVTIQTGEADIDYQVNEIVGTPVPPATTGTNYSSSFKGGGGISIYLGQPVDSPTYITTTGGANSSANRAMLNPSSANRLWYNTAQEMDWSGVTSSGEYSVQVPFQEPGPLVYDTVTSEPDYAFQAQALFAGQGSNAQLNGNQYMFSTRWIAQGNMRGVRSGRTRRDSNYNVLFTATMGEPRNSFPWQKFNNGPGSASNRTSAGQGHDWIGTPLAPADVTLFEFPYDNQPLQSIGQLQHANLSLVGSYPSYPVGNSLADFRLPGVPGTAYNPLPAGWQLARVDVGSGNQGMNYLGSDMNGYYDISYLLNRTLWDRYYFSTVPATGTIAPTDTFPNTRHLRYDTTVDLQNPDRSAAGLVLAGGFNINSTSEQAWRAVLGGSNQLVFDPEKPDAPSTISPLKTTFPRFTRPNAGDDPNDVWKGYRTLDANQIAQLARNIVAQIRARGPFVSLADFINRRLTDNAATTEEDETFRGPIQAAIDSTTSSAVSGQYPANDAAAGTFWSQDSLITSSGSFINQSSQYSIGCFGQPQLEGRFKNSTATADAAVAPYGDRCVFAPKYITQADILAKIGAGLSARSDTFTIRSYGETVNPALSPTDAGYITGRAWCEAVVQRLPEYIEPQTATSGNKPEDAVSTLTTQNQKFGRKFKIISFRWLSPNDI
ncbi:MAG: hypothetical protein WC661_08660 [Opitutaceae bacterium]|jgi:hypothetical protein